MLGLIKNVASLKVYLIIGGIVLAILGGMSAYIWHLESKLTRANEKTGELTEKNKTLTTDLKQAYSDIENERAEFQNKVILALDTLSKQKVVEGETKIIKEEVTIYRDNPNVKRVTLDANWVCLHDRASRTGMSTISSPSTLTCSPRAPGYDTSWKPIEDYLVVNVIADNYAKYNTLRLYYKELYEGCTKEKLIGWDD